MPKILWAGHPKKDRMRPHYYKGPEQGKMLLDMQTGWDATGMGQDQLVDGDN